MAVACAAGGAVPRTWALSCDQDLSAAVSIDDSTGTATVTVRGESRTLQQQPSVTGERYAGNGWAMWRDGDEASLKIDYGRVNCRVASGVAAAPPRGQVPTPMPTALMGSGTGGVSPPPP